MTKFNDLAENYKLTKLLKERAHTSKETKEKLNEMATFVSTYVLTVLSEVCKDKKIDTQHIEKVFRSLNKK